MVQLWGFVVLCCFCVSGSLLSAMAGSCGNMEPVNTICSLKEKQVRHAAGDGHFSPIGGFHASKDMVLILDTARFKYPPHWVPMAQLHQAMAAVDPATGKARGFIRLAANPKLDSVMFTLKRPTRCAKEKTGKSGKRKKKQKRQRQCCLVSCCWTTSLVVAMLSTPRSQSVM